MRRLLVPFLAVSWLGLLHCSAPPSAPPDSGTTTTDAGSTPVDAGPDFRDGGLPGLPLGAWRWVPVDGTRCASGSTTGLGVNLGPSTRDLLIYFQGGGACWNQGTCVPSWLRFGPICYYDTTCLYSGPGGQQPTASYVTHPDPYPRDGGGAFPQDVAGLSASVLLHRELPDNPFKDATFVMVPYCTGDLHAGDADRTYSYKAQAFDPVSQYTVHFAGKKNVLADLAWLTQTLPGVRRVFVLGSSAGGYGAQLNFERIRAAFPSAEVHLLSDSAPLFDTPHWTEWRDTWNLDVPQGCDDCDAGFPGLHERLATLYPDSRQALLTREKDPVITWYFYGGLGPDPALNPPYSQWTPRLDALLALDATRPAVTADFVATGADHVLLPFAGVVRADGGVTAPVGSRDAGVPLDAFIKAWATGGAAWKPAP